MANTYTLISSTTLSTATNSVTFSSIPSAYSDLVLRMSVRGDGNSLSSRMRFNGSTAGYAVNDMIGLGSGGVVYEGYINNTEIDTTRGGQANTNYAANAFSSIDVYIPSYTASNGTKPVNVISSTENATLTNYIDVMAAQWANSAAISTILVYPSTGNFVANSSFRLYGIKNT